jgi:predicted nucleotide-binding protein (sugar kinase/HSP70/actin superfamily)
MVTIAAEIIDDLFREVESSINCLAKNPKLAQKTFKTELDKVAKAAEKGIMATEMALRQMAKSLAKIQLHTKANTMPKILIIGGIARIQIDKSVKDFFEKRGILVKVNDATEFLSFLAYENIMKLNFELGRMDPKEQLSWFPLLADLLNPTVPNKSMRLEAISDRFGIGAIELFYNRWHSIVAKSNLMFSQPIALQDILSSAAPYVPTSTSTEASTTLGRYLLAVENKIFNGIVNLRTFNCAPANISEALIRPIATQHDISYVSLEVDGEKLSAGQLLKLETLAEQCLQKVKEN